jgi:acetolactate synthase-1/2/3 large subunit
MTPNPKSTTVAHLIARALESEGVEHVFGMPGSHVLAIFDAVADTRIRHVAAAHEGTSAFMAGMYGHLTGRPGVALLTAGPGATNSLTGVAQAYASSLPLVQITGDVPLRARREAFHGTDAPDFLHKVFAPVTKWSVRLDDPEKTSEVLAKAFAIAREGRPGPVHISVPMDLARAEVPAGTVYQPRPSRQQVPSPRFVSQVVEGLARAKRPTICVCRGVLAADAGAELERLADALGAPVLSTAYGLGAFPQDHPLAVGTFSEFSQNTFAFELIRQSDFLLVLGLRAETLMTDALAKIAPANSAFVAFEDSEVADLGWPGASEACSVKSFLAALLDHRARFGQPDPDRALAIAAQEQAFRRGLAALVDGSRDAEPIHFGEVMRQLNQHLAPDAITVSGVGNHHVWARNLLAVRNRESFMAEAAWGTMGGELGGGIVAKMVHPERQVVVVTGDGSLLMVGCDVLTAVKERANVLIVVLNDGHHGIIGAMQRQMFGRAYGDLIGRVNFADLAESLGAVGLRVTSPGELSATVRRAIAQTAHAPVVLDVVCGANFPWPNRDKLVQSGRALLEGGIT